MHTLEEQLVRLAAPVVWALPARRRALALSLALQQWDGEEGGLVGCRLRLDVADAKASCHYCDALCASWWYVLLSVCMLVYIHVTH